MRRVLAVRRDETRRRRAVDRREPDLGRLSGRLCAEHDLVAVGRDIVVADRDAREDRFTLARVDVGAPERRRRVRRCAAHVIQALRVGGEPRHRREAETGHDVPFRRERTIAGGVVDPDGAAVDADGRHERAVGRYGDAVLLGGSERELLGLAVRESLPPQMMLLGDRGGEVHPFAVRGPAGRRAGTGGPNRPSARIAGDRHEPARLPDRAIIHLDNERPFAIRRRVRVMRHRALVRWEIHLAVLRPAPRRDDHAEVHAALDLREEQVLRVEPRQAGGIRHQQARLALQRRHGVSAVPGRRVHRVGDFRAVGRERQTVLRPPILDERRRLAARQHFQIDLIGRQEPPVAANERQHPSVRRQRRRDRRVGEVGQLRIDKFAARPRQRAHDERRDDERGNRRGDRDWKAPSANVGRRRRHGANRLHAHVAEARRPAAELDARRRERRREHVSATRHCPNHLLRLITERAPDLEEALRQRIVGDGRLRPDGVDELALGDQAAVALDEIREHLERLAAQRHLPGALPQEAAVQIEHEVAEPVLPPGIAFGDVGLAAAHVASPLGDGNRGRTRGF